MINKFINKFYVFSVIIFSGLILSSLFSGCSQKITPKFLRDRDFDYQRHSVVQPSEVTIPAGVKKPDFAPYYKLPKGQNIYPKSKSKSHESSDVLPPPGFPTKIK